MRNPWNGGQLKIKTYVGTCQVRLMNLHRQDVRSLCQEQWTDIGREKSCAVIGRHRGGKRCVSDGARRHVEARGLHAVQVNNRAVITEHSKNRVGVVLKPSGLEALPKIRCRVFARSIRAET